MYNFPDAPTVGLTTTTPDGVTYAWDGQKWTASSSSIPVPLTVPLGGTGAIDLPLPPHAATTGMVGSVLLGTGTTPAISHPSAGYWDAAGVGINSAGGGTAYLDLATSSGTPAAPTALLAGQPLGEVSFSGHDGAAWVYSGATISPIAIEPWTAAAHGTDLILWAATQGTAGPMPRLRVNSAMPLPGVDILSGTADNRLIASTYGHATYSEFDLLGTDTAGLALTTSAVGATVGWWDLTVPPPAVPGQLNFSVAGAQPTYFNLVCEMTVETTKFFKYVTIVNELAGYAGTEILAKDDFAWIDFNRFNTMSGLPVGTSAGNVLGVVMAGGFDNTAIAYGMASMEFNTSENWTAAAHGTAISFWNTINGTPGPRERLRIGSDALVAPFIFTAGIQTNRVISTIWGDDAYGEVDVWSILPDATYPNGIGAGLWTGPNNNSLGGWGGLPLNIYSDAGLLNMTLIPASTTVYTPLNVNSGIVNLGPTATPTAAQIAHTAGLGVSMVVGGPFGFYVGQTLGQPAWVWINAGGIANATGIYHGTGSIGSPVTGGGPLFYMNENETLWHLGGGIGQPPGGTTDNPKYHFKDYQTKELMTLDSYGDLGLWCYDGTTGFTRPHMDLYAANGTGTAPGWSEIDMYANTGGHAMLIMANADPGGPLNGFMTWDLTGAGNHPTFMILRGFTGIPLSIDGTAFVTDQGNAVKPGGGGWVAPSDIRMKRNVADYTTGLAALRQLRPVTYQYNGSYGIPDDGRTYTGLVADEVELIMPEMVGTEQRAADPGPFMIDHTPTELDKRRAIPNPERATKTLEAVKTLDHTALTFALINALKEVADRLDALEAGTTAMAAAPVRPRNGNRTARPRH